MAAAEAVVSIKKHDKKKHGKNDIAGAVLGHGLTIDDQLVVIPEGIELRPLSQLGCDLALGRGAPIFDDEQMAILSDADTRGMAWDIGDEGMAHIYEPGDVIYDMSIKFRFTWDENEVGKIPRYYSTGIVTAGRLFENIQVGDGEDTNRELTSKEQGSALLHHNKKIISNIWDRSMTLGEILRYLSEYRRQRIEERVRDRVTEEGIDGEQGIREAENQEIDRYYVISCRGLGGRVGIIEQIECFPDLAERAPAEPRVTIKRQLSQDDILKSFVDDMIFLAQVIGNLARPGRDLTETYNRIADGLGENNTMSMNDFCQIKRYVELFKRDLPPTDIIRKRIQYSANRARLCNMLEILKILKEYRYNMTPDLAELIVLNTPKKLTGGLSDAWRVRFEAIVDDITYDKKVVTIQKGIAQYTQYIRDEYNCPNIEEVGLEGGDYYQMYLKNRQSYLNLK
jgi:hypothetical protein